MDVTTSESAVGGEIVTPKPRPRVSALFTWIVIAPFAVWAVTRLFGLEYNSFTAQVVTATPYAAIASLVPLLIALLSRRPVAIVAAVATTAALAAAVLPRTVASAQPAASGPTLRVLSTNLLFGRGDTAALVELVRRLRPDVLSAQELPPRAVAELDQAGLRELLPYRVLHDEFGAGGSGLYARYPLTELPALFRPIGHNMPAARMSLPGGAQVELVAVHTFPPLGARQTLLWREGLHALPSAPESGPYRILVGDFNASLDHAPFRALVDRGYVDAAEVTGNGLIPTWPANRRVPPMITIDHLLADRRLTVTGYQVHDLPGTDHRPILTELRLPR